MADIQTADIQALARLLAGQGKDPMRGINSRFGPMTPRTMAGLPEGEMRAAELPTMGERVGDAVLDYGPLPAKMAVDVAMQPVRAGQAVGDAMADPTIGNITNAGVQTGLALFQPGKALGALAGGYGLAAAKDAGIFGSPAEASGLSPDQIKRKAELQKRIEKASWKSAAERRAVESELADLREIEKQFALGANKGQQEEYDRKTAEAEALAKRARARDTRFSDSSLKDVYEKTGGPIPLAAGAAGVVGALHRTAPAWQKWLEGSGAAFTVNNAPMGYDAIMSPAVNPEYEAVTALAQNLPDGHPQKQKYVDLAAQMLASGQDRNPVNKAAWDQFTDLPLMAKRLGMSGVEGLTALIGGQVPKAIGDTVKGTAQLPGIALEGFETGLEGAARAAASRQAAANQIPKPLAPQGALAPPPPPAPPPPAGPGGNPAGMQAPVPGGALAPVPVPPPNPRPAPKPAPQGALRGAYGPPEQAVARPFIESEVAAGRAVPDSSLLQQQLSAGGLNRPLPSVMGDKLSNAQGVVDTLRAKGLSDDAIATILADLMKSGAVKGLPAVAGGAIGLGALASGYPDP